MKTKNVFLGLAALFCAVGSTFASLSAVVPHYVNVKYAATQIWSCVTVQKCTVSGTTPCSVTIQSFTAPVYDIKQNATTCNTRILANRALDGTSTLPTIDAVR
ncbi:DUF6520 family protein [Parachryseolinea silvisoli]|uniref:DUF6520 family protein n=1 Tax=Parachryseolinea silvisoli TaxID=2873601 RepID=UPI002265E1A8|nr:DUF6520 family protein [Parachryseolinea silvisoli]MCD9015443.1 DUF6520 family protein [Parachryseolinea silvisoli]